MKKKIPIALRKALDKEVEGTNGLFNIDFPNNSIIKFTDSDSNSDFFFEIKKINPAQGTNKVSYLIEYKPYNEESLSARHLNVNISNFSDHFKNWKNLLIESNKDSFLFDDLITQTYYDELEPKFEILDDDIQTKPYSIEQQKRIVIFLDKAQEILKNQEKDNLSVNEAITLIEETKENISISTKKKVITNIRKIIAKGFKIGLEVGEKLLIEFTTELAKKLITGT